ncbi:MAG TPA: ABC transporter, partial [Burkholderiaceae bacterium]|nr:ABC transporter [Burkholderiaceae bacterium]
MTEPRSASWREARGQPRALSGLLPFLRPYRWQVALAGLFLLLAAGTTLAFPMALRQLVDAGLAAPDRGQQLLALRGHFALLFGVAGTLVGGWSSSG